ncbi:hypothetical protein ES703_60512 [subsurface metagenome]
MRRKIIALIVALLVLYAPIQLTNIERVYVSMFGWCAWGILDMVATWGLYAIALFLLWKLSKSAD